ncbi:MAG: NPCBM/NEW2 domain-containing protein [Kiritimatiellia bacterium]
MPQVRLTSLKPLSVKVGWGELKTGASADGRPLTVGRKVVADGLGMHANGEVVYERKPGWKRFVATVGLNESQRSQAAASVNFRVVAETAAGARTVLVTTPVLRYDGLESAPINVALPPDAVRIRLEVLDGGDGIRCDHANWGDPGFVTE